MATRVERSGIEACITKVNSAIEELKNKFPNVYLCTPEKYGVEIISICE